MDKEQEIVNKVIKIAVIVLVAILGLIAFFNSFYTVNAGQRAILLTFGNPSETAKSEGLHFKIPFAQQAVLMTIQTQKYEADASAASKDLQIVSAKIATNYHIIPEQVVKIYTTLGLGYMETVIQPMEQEVVKATTAQFTAEELITKREAAREKIKEILTQRLRERGIVVEEVSITNFDFSKSFNDAIESKVTAEQLKLKADRDLERIEVEAKQIKATAIGQKEAAIAQAEGNRQATILNAEGNKQSLILNAQAKAESIRLIQDELSKSPDYIEYYQVDKWSGNLPQVTGNGAIPFFDVNK